jgi:hypothetical protein
MSISPRQLEYFVADFKDADSYRACDQDAEHNRVRARLAPLAEQIARVQFGLPDV